MSEKLIKSVRSDKIDYLKSQLNMTAKTKNTSLPQIFEKIEKKRHLYGQQKFKINKRNVPVEDGKCCFGLYRKVNIAIGTQMQNNPTKYNPGKT